MALLIVGSAGAPQWGPAWADAVKDREGAVRNDKAALEQDARWIYNDWQVGLAEGRRTGKPVLMVLRCVPCIACTGIDAQVVLQSEALQALMSRFVCVRVINANGLDLSLFQFDHDLSFSALMFNGDGTLYGRYGSWTHQKDAQDKSTAGFRAALEGALALHAGYPGNRAALAGKLGPKSPFKTPVDIPTLSGKYKLELDWNGKVVPSCVHCHQISDALRLHHRNRGEAIPEELVYPWPGPETVGFSLASDAAARVTAVQAGSAAAKAGLKAGDELRTLDGQPLISGADVSWVLHRAPAAGTLVAVVKRDGREETFRLGLPDGWRHASDISRRAGTWGFRAMALGGLQLEELTGEERRALSLAEAQTGLRVKHAGEYGKHAAAKKAGFRKGDVIVGLEGVSGRVSEGELIGLVMRTRRAGDQIKTTVVRDGARMELPLPVQ